MLLPQERIPWILRFPVFHRDVLFRLDDGKPSVYLTFDDGPIPESTPWILSALARYDAKATFFMVADNARRYPHLHKAVVEAGHAVGNHTFHHVPPFRQSVEQLLADLELADSFLNSRLFRPPHGLILPSQQRAVIDAGYRIVMFDLNTLDYRADRNAQQIIESVARNVWPGCIINLHDSLKSIGKLKTALPAILDLLRERGLAMECLPQETLNTQKIMI